MMSKKTAGESIDSDWAKTEREAARERRRKKAAWEKATAKGAVIVLGKSDRGPRARRTCESGAVTSYLSVEAIARDAHVAHFVSRYCYAGLDMPYPTRGRSGKRKRPPVTVEIHLTEYLTKDVPDRLRVRRFVVRRDGEILVHAAKMYARIFTEDERLGGESWPERKRRIARGRKKEAKEGRKKKFQLLNRTHGPYVWGHDLGDLSFTEILVRWTGERSCVAYVHVDS